jgi:hypothetical protein
MRSTRMQRVAAWELQHCTKPKQTKINEMDEAVGLRKADGSKHRSTERLGSLQLRESRTNRHREHSHGITSSLCHGISASLGFPFAVLFVQSFACTGTSMVEGEGERRFDLPCFYSRAAATHVSLFFSVKTNEQTRFVYSILRDLPYSDHICLLAPHSSPLSKRRSTSYSTLPSKFSPSTRSGISSSSSSPSFFSPSLSSPPSFFCRDW